ncbi:MAG: hypothetical protein WBV73_28790 [Phormidium sp.]
MLVAKKARRVFSGDGDRALVIYLTYLTLAIIQIAWTNPGT